MGKKKYKACLECSYNLLCNRLQGSVLHSHYAFKCSMCSHFTVNIQGLRIPVPNSCERVIFRNSRKYRESIVKAHQDWSSFEALCRSLQYGGRMVTFERVIKEAKRRFCC